MTQLVFIQNGNTVTDSLTVAEVFGKRHSDVLRSIANLECSEEFNERNFASVDYIDGKGETRPKFIISQDGFSFLAMSYTGKEAARFKEMYITEFNRMKDEISKPPVLTERQAIIQSLKLTAEVAEEVEVVKATTAEHGTKLVEIEQKLDKQITLNSGQQRTLQKAISRKVYAIEPDKDERGELFQQLHREIKDRWQVTSYKDVLRKELENVLNYITYWRPIKKGE
ncbi:Rha family transcriptional regulator [Paenibacillus polymyxa]|uniref:Rha family transcriptional regulator n=1 Tax=Paenibacillus polymyxa TaxID=1406 RepID=A0A8I1LPH5_PAEPO|nr:MULTISPECIES: Rha family transcriptional regulator [Paenibacillus]KAF6576536.1 Rha family transcriptional regulator [Paenibacillus sp. EKM206P]KAF6591330.1 Rha family transcriptional regulator [Paenibacillus sp. EKM205P]MBM0632020.1 Rha family transcriptional regulator [Paenibacillus polymyxa]